MMNEVARLYEAFVKTFPYQPTLKQNELLRKMADFVINGGPKGLFLMKGYAGTGKTSIISAVVNNLATVRVQSVLMAPTGRAAKVMGSYAKRQAFTIHKKIYFPKKASTGGMSFVLQKNKHQIIIINPHPCLPQRQHSRLQLQIL